MLLCLAAGPACCWGKDWPPFYRILGCCAGVWCCWLIESMYAAGGVPLVVAIPMLPHSICCQPKTDRVCLLSATGGPNPPRLLPPGTFYSLLLTRCCRCPVCVMLHVASTPAAAARPTRSNTPAASPCLHLQAQQQQRRLMTVLKASQPQQMTATGRLQKGVAPMP